jgi:DNA modification methylase
VEAAGSGARSRGRAPADPWRDAIIHGDALRVLQRLPSGSVHLAVTSPPYNVGILYAGYADDLHHDEYLGWLSSVWKELLRVLVPGGRFALNVAPTSIKDFHPIHHDLSTDLRGLGYIMRTEIIWYKQTMGRRTAWGSWKSPANPHIVPSWEYVLVFSKGSWKLEGDRADIDITGPEFQQFSDGHWFIQPERHRRGHPAPFPEELIQRLVKYYSYRRNVVLDMFGGTGTVAAVARSHGRHFVHIDASSEYCQQALDRVLRSVPAEGTTIPAPVRVVEEAELGSPTPGSRGSAGRGRRRSPRAGGGTRVPPRSGRASSSA